MKVTCEYCGLPFSVRRVEPQRAVYCCSGCAVAARIPVGGGDWPLTPELGLACAIGFLGFNQALMEILAGLLAGDGKLDAADGARWASLGLGVVVWGLLVWLQRRTGANTVGDGVVLAATGLTMVAAWVTGNAWCAIGANAGFVAWSVRGWARAQRRG
jgi:hypothetical protein